MCSCMRVCAHVCIDWKHDQGVSACICVCAFMSMCVTVCLCVCVYVCVCVWVGGRRFKAWQKCLWFYVWVYVCVSTFTVQKHYKIIIIIIIIISRHQHGYPWPFLDTLLYPPLLPGGLQDYIQYWHRATVCRFKNDLSYFNCWNELLWEFAKSNVDYFLVVVVVVRGVEGIKIRSNVTKVKFIFRNIIIIIIYSNIKSDKNSFITNLGLWYLCLMAYQPL